MTFGDDEKKQLFNQSLDLLNDSKTTQKRYHVWN